MSAVATQSELQNESQHEVHSCEPQHEPQCEAQSAEAPVRW